MVAKIPTLTLCYKLLNDKIAIDPNSYLPRDFLPRNARSASAVLLS